jgi:hypothetical protein
MDMLKKNQIVDIKMSIKYLKTKSKLNWDFEINHTHLGTLLPHLAPYPPQTMDSIHSIKDLPRLFEKQNYVQLLSLLRTYDYYAKLQKEDFDM